VNYSRDIASVAALLADPSRARVLGALMDGRSLTATELAFQARVSAQTASGHLAKLTRASLLACETSGRCRYYRLAGPAVAEALEALAILAPNATPDSAESQSEIEQIRFARTCYDHLAGRLGVAITEAMIRRGYLRTEGRDFRVTAPGASFLSELGVNMDKTKRQRRAFARKCVDWTERRPHLAGALGGALAARWLQQDWVRRMPEGRQLLLTPKGGSALYQWFGVKPTSLSALPGDRGAGGYCRSSRA
jgi:DNA-binding transcriptional ArsR family regulator